MTARPEFLWSTNGHGPQNGTVTRAARLRGAEGVVTGFGGVATVPDRHDPGPIHSIPLKGATSDQSAMARRRSLYCDRTTFTAVDRARAPHVCSVFLRLDTVDRALQCGRARRSRGGRRSQST